MRRLVKNGSKRTFSKKIFQKLEKNRVFKKKPFLKKNHFRNHFFLRLNSINKKIPEIGSLSGVSREKPVKMVLIDFSDVNFKSQTLIAAAENGRRSSSYFTNLLTTTNLVEAFLTSVKAKYVDSLQTIVLLIDREADEINKNVLREKISSENLDTNDSEDHKPAFLRMIDRLRPPSPLD